MALIKCPECGRERVSDSAQMCPNCGYGIKAHFERLKIEKRKQQVRRLKEAKKPQEEYTKGVSQLKRPKFTASILTALISILWLWSGVVQLNASETEVYTIDDIYALPEGERAELVDGYIYYMVPPNTKHQRLLNFINTEIEMV